MGIEAKLIKLSAQTTQRELEATIDELNNDLEIDGIIVQVNKIFLIYNCLIFFFNNFLNLAF